MKFEFKSDLKLKKIISTSLKGKRFYPYTKEEATERGIWLVKDEGVYVMPSVKIEGKPPVVYAEGFGPDCEYIGGDDFVEFVELSAAQVSKLFSKDASLHVLLTETKIEVGV